MKIPTLKRLTLEDYPDLPEQMQAVFETINSNLEPMVDALQKRINGADNLESEDSMVQFTSGVEFEVKLQSLKSKPRFVRVSPETYDSAIVKWELSKPETVRMTITLATAPTDEQKAWVRFEP